MDKAQIVSNCRILAARSKLVLPYCNSFGLTIFQHFLKLCIKSHFFVCMCVCMCVRECVRVRMCMYVCVCVCVVCPPNK